MRLLSPCFAERAGCAGKQRRYVSNSNANISTYKLPEYPVVLEDVSKFKAAR